MFDTTRGISSHARRELDVNPNQTLSEAVSAGSERAYPAEAFYGISHPVAELGAKIDVVIRKSASAVLDLVASSALR